MRLKNTLAALALGLATLSVPAVAQDKPEPARVYKDWVVGCDKGRNCEAVVLQPSLTEDDLLTMVFWAAPLQGSVKIALVQSHFYDNVSQSKTMILRVDGKSIATLQMKEEGGEWTGTLSRDQAIVLANGRNATAHASDGAYFAISLSGSNAAMRDMDARQGNSGSNMALVAHGPKLKSPVPVLHGLTKRANLAPSNAVPPQTIIAKAIVFGACEEERYEGDENQDAIHPLSRQNEHRPMALILVGCSHGAYNYTVQPVLATQQRDGSWTLSETPVRKSIESFIRLHRGSARLLVLT